MCVFDFLILIETRLGGKRFAGLGFRWVLSMGEDVNVVLYGLLRGSLSVPCGEDIGVSR